MFVIKYLIDYEEYEHSSYLTYADAARVLDELDEDSFDCAWIEEVEE